MIQELFCTIIDPKLILDYEVPNKENSINKTMNK